MLINNKIIGGIISKHRLWIVSKFSTFLCFTWNGVARVLRFYTHTHSARQFVSLVDTFESQRIQLVFWLLSIQIRSYYYYMHFKLNLILTTRSFLSVSSHIYINGNFSFAVCLIWRIRCDPIPRRNRRSRRMLNLFSYFDPLRSIWLTLCILCIALHRSSLLSIICHIFPKSTFQLLKIN